MSIIAIDIGTTTTKIIEYREDKITNKEIVQNKNIEEILDSFLNKNSINKSEIEFIALTGIGADKVNLTNLNIPVRIVEEFKAIAMAGKYLSNKEEILVASIGTGTALIRVNKDEFKHLGGTGIGAGTLTNLCKIAIDTDSFEEIVELSKKGNLEKIDIRIGDITDKKISTLPQDLTLSNFGKLSNDAKKEDIALGIVNMVFETIGMMSAFSLKNDTINEVVLIGNILKIPRVAEISKKIEKLHGISFIITENPEYAVALGAIKEIEQTIK